MPAANQLTTSTSSPTPASPEFSRFLAFIRSGMTVHQGGKVTVAHGRRSTAFREAATARLSLLDRWLTPGPAERVAETVADLLTTTDKRNASPQAAAKIVSGWLSVLSPLPAWAVSEAALSLARTPGGFGPSPGDLFAAAEALTAPYEAERMQIGMLLDADEEPAPAPVPALASGSLRPYDPRVRPIGRFEQVKPESERIIVPATDEELRDRLGVRAPAPSDALVSMMSRKTEDAA